LRSQEKLHGDLRRRQLLRHRILGQKEMEKSDRTILETRVYLFFWGLLLS
jgi:hypothetical protein